MLSRGARVVLALLLSFVFASSLSAQTPPSGSLVSHSPTIIQNQTQTRVDITIKNNSYGTRFRILAASNTFTISNPGTTVFLSNGKTAVLPLFVNPGTTPGNHTLRVTLQGADEFDTETNPSYVNVHTQDFIIQAMYPPTEFLITQPPYNAVLDQLMDLNFTISDGASGYDVAVYRVLNNGIVQPPVITRTNIVAGLHKIDVSSLERGSLFQVNVTAKNAIGSRLNNSAPWYFSTKALPLPQPFDILAPKANQTMPLNPTFTWSASTNATHYNLSVFPDTGGLTTGEAIRTVSNITTTSHAWENPPLQPGRYYRVVVVAVAEGGLIPSRQALVRFYSKPAPAALSSEWFLAEGAALPVFDTFYLIANPNDFEIDVTVDLLVENGENKQLDMKVPAAGRATIKVNDYVSNTGVSGVIREKNGHRFAAERAMYSLGEGKRWTGAHAVAGIQKLQPEWFLAEGATTPAGPAQSPFETYILVANPNPANIDVEFTFFIEGGEPVQITMPMPANRRLTVSPNTLDPRLVNKGFSTRVRSTGGEMIAVERAMWWRASNWPQSVFMEGNASPGLSELHTNWYLAEGNTTSNDDFLLLVNPQSSPTQVTVRYIFESDPPVSRQFTILPNQRKTINVRHDPEGFGMSGRHGTAIFASAPIAVERSMYFSSEDYGWVGGHNSVASPVLAFEWVLPEGADVPITGSRLRTEILIANPTGSAGTVDIDFLLTDGTIITQQISILGNRRSTFRAENIPQLVGKSFSIVVRAAIPVVVERSMYFGTDQPTAIGKVGGTCSLGIPRGELFRAMEDGTVAKVGVADPDSSNALPSLTATPTTSPTPVID